MPSITVPQALWDLAQQVSGRKNPAGFIRNEVLLPWAMKAQAELTAPTCSETSVSYPLSDAPKVELDPPGDPKLAADFLALLRRKTRLDCVDNSFDPDFTTAWAWACNEFNDERQLVEFLEDKVSLPAGRLTNPRGMIIARWKSATTPGVPRRG